MTINYVPLLNHPDYEIMDEYPFTIRRVRDGYEVTESFVTGGYPRVYLNRKQYLKHVLIAEQFVENDDPDHKTQVDHINRDRSDYHRENLHWVSPSENCRNKSSHRGVVYVYVDDIPDESMVVDFYDTNNTHHEFDNYFFYNDVFYQWNGINYRTLHINENKSGNKYVMMRDIDGKVVSIYYSKFKQQHDLV